MRTFEDLARAVQPSRKASAFCLSGWLHNWRKFSFMYQAVGHTLNALQGK